MHSAVGPESGAVVPAGRAARPGPVGEGGRLQSDCNAEGALFTVARAGDDVFQVLRAVAGGQTDVRAVRAVRRRSWPCFR